MSLENVMLCAEREISNNIGSRRRGYNGWVTQIRYDEPEGEREGKMKRRRAVVVRTEE